MRGRSLAVTLGVSKRSAIKVFKNPITAAAPLAVPLFMFAAFAGAMSAIASTPGFDYYNYSAFIFVFVLFEATVFVGIFTGIEMASDFGGGFGDRMMLAAPVRLSILAGYIVFAIARGLLSVAIVWLVAIVTGMPVRGGALEIVGLVALAIMVGTVTTLWAAGVALRMRTITAAALIFMPSFVVLFITPDFVPRPLLTGWLHTAASVNPLTPAIEAGRAYLASTPANTGLAFGVTAGLIVVFAVWAVRGMRSAEQGPKEPRARGRATRRDRGNAGEHGPDSRRARGPAARGPRARRARAGG